MGNLLAHPGGIKNVGQAHLQSAVELRTVRSQGARLGKVNEEQAGIVLGHSGVQKPLDHETFEPRHVRGHPETGRRDDGYRIADADVQIGGKALAQDDGGQIYFAFGAKGSGTNRM